MSKRKKSKENRHIKRLMPSARSDVGLCLRVEQDFLDLCKMHFRTKGYQLIIPESLNSEMLRWREMAVRFKSGDYRHKLVELKSLHTIAQWIVNVKCDLVGKPHVKIDWAYGEG